MEEEDDDDEWRPQQFYLDVISGACEPIYLYNKPGWSSFFIRPFRRSSHRSSVLPSIQGKERENDDHSWQRPGVIHMIMWVRNYNPMLLDAAAAAAPP
jgi:hypothetical protein